MELQVLENTLPLKAYPEKDLDAVLNTKFKYWLSQLLSIKSDNEEKVDVALPIIKKKFWSLGINEVKKAFEMYALGELGITPKSNYFDIILVGQIFNAYKLTQRPRAEKTKIEIPQISEAEKEMLFIQSVINCFESYKYDKTMTTGFTAIYQHFYEKDKFPKHDAKFREQVRTRALVKLKTTATTGLISKAVKNYSEERIAMMCKELILGDWFETVTNIEKEI